MRNCRLSIPNLADDLLVAVDDLAHAGLDHLQLVGGEGLGAGEVVVEAVLDRRADRHLGVGIELLPRRRHDMGGVVAQQLQRLFAVAGDDGDLRVPLQRAGQVHQPAVDLHDDGVLRKLLADRGGQFQAGNRIVEMSDGAVRQRDVGHSLSLLPPGGRLSRPARWNLGPAPRGRVAGDQAVARSCPSAPLCFASISAKALSSASKASMIERWRAFTARAGVRISKSFQTPPGGGPPSFSMARKASRASRTSVLAPQRPKSKT